MTRLTSHLDEHALSRVLTNENVSEAVREHLEGCTQCRDEVDHSRTIEARVRALPAPTPDDRLLTRIRASLRAPHDGDRWEPRAHRGLHRLSWIASVAAAAVLVAVTFLLWPTGSATAGMSAGDLRFSPAAPTRGATIDVTYVPGELLARHERLHLRARWRTALDLPGPQFVRQTTAAVLERDARGIFHARFRIPDSAVYGAFAVETPDAGRVDANIRRRWELLVHERDGRPSYYALEQKVSDLMGENWEQALATARQATAHYPNLVRPWIIRDVLESAILPRSSLDSAIATHRARLADFDRTLSAVERLDPDQIGAMQDYASMLSDSALHAKWFARALREAPNSIWTLNAVSSDLAMRARRDSKGALASLDSIWRITGDLHPGVLTFGFAAAQMSQDTAALRVWADRLANSSRGLPPFIVYQALLPVPPLHAYAEERIRLDVARLTGRNDSLRALDHDTLAGRLALDRWRRDALVALGNALVADGDLNGAADTLALAATMTWDAKLFRRIASLHLRRGDTSAAELALARAAADPLHAQSVRDSLPILLGAKFDSVQWQRDQRAASNEMRTTVIAGARSIPLRGHVRITRSDGAEVELRDVMGGRPTLVAFWSRACQPSIQQMPALVQTSAALRKLGYRVVLVTEESPKPEVAEFLKSRGLEVDTFYDQRRELRRALSQWGTPELYVLDGRGRVRFPNTTLTAASAQLASLDGG